MLEKIDFIKWLIELTPQKRKVAYTAAIILSLVFLVYGLGKYIESSIERDRKECLDNINRLTTERDNIQIKLEVAQDKYLKRIETENDELKKLRNKTEELIKEIK